VPLQTLYVCFGTDIIRWKNIGNSFLSSIEAVLHGLQFDELQAVNQYLGPLVSFSFLFICLFFMLNTFLALIMKSYDKVSKMKDEDSLSKEFAKGVFPLFKSISERLSKLSRKRKVKDEGKHDRESKQEDKTEKKQAWPEVNDSDKNGEHFTDKLATSTSLAKPDERPQFLRQRTLYRR